MKKAKPRAAKKGKRSRRAKRGKEELADIDFYSYQKVFRQKPE